MMTKNVKKILITIIVMLVCIAIIQWVRFLRGSGSDDIFQITSKRIHGNPRASVQVIEYMDFRCGPCGYGAKWLKDFIEKYPDKIYLEVRHFPLHLNHGALAARFSECGLKQGKFWEIHDALFQKQREWVRLSNPKAFFKRIAKQSQMDIEALEVCWDDPKLYETIIEIKHQAKELGVNATPTYFINGKMFVGAGKMSKEVLRLLGMTNKELTGVYRSGGNQ